MGLRIILLLGAMLFLMPLNSYSSWQGPLEIVSGTWGSGNTNFGVERGDTSDRFPDLTAVLFNEKIIISDQVNEREVVYNNDGSLFKIVPWEIIANGQSVPNPDFIKYHYWDVQGYTSGAGIWIKFEDYLLVNSSTGETIKTSATKPTELGVVSEQKLGLTKYKITITYPDKTYGLSSDREFSKILRDAKGYVYGINMGGVWRFNECGKLESSVLMPRTQKNVTPGTGNEEPYVVIKGQYGEPLVAPNGDLYSSRKTTKKFSILKWTWVDDPNVPTGPDAPIDLSVMPSTSGLYLTWTASPQDPGCVTGYEIAQSTSSSGVYSTIATVNKGVLKFNDTSAVSGSTYYYKVRAVAGSEYSPYTNPVSGTKP